MSVVTCTAFSTTFKSVKISALQNFLYLFSFIECLSMSFSWTLNFNFNFHSVVRLGAHIICALLFFLVNLHKFLFCNFWFSFHQSLCFASRFTFTVSRWFFAARRFFSSFTPFLLCSPYLFENFECFLPCLQLQEFPTSLLPHHMSELIFCACCLYQALE